MKERTDLAFAPFFPRLAALLLDDLVLAAALFLPRLIVWGAALGGAEALTHRVLFHHTLSAVIFYLLRSAYFVALTYTSGCTLGKRAMGLKVVTADGGRCRFFDVLYRETVGRYLSGILCIGYLLAVGDGEHRALHDRICDTRVIWGEPEKHGRSPQKGTLRKVEVDDPVKDWYKPYRI